MEDTPVEKDHLDRVMFILQHFRFDHNKVTEALDRFVPTNFKTTRQRPRSIFESKSVLSLPHSSGENMLNLRYRIIKQQTPGISEKTWCLAVQNFLHWRHNGKEQFIAWLVAPSIPHSAPDLAKTGAEQC